MRIPIWDKLYQNEFGVNYIIWMGLNNRFDILLYTHTILHEYNFSQNDDKIG